MADVYPLRWESARQVGQSALAMILKEQAAASTSGINFDIVSSVHQGEIADPARLSHRLQWHIPQPVYPTPVV